MSAITMKAITNSKPKSCSHQRAELHRKTAGWCGGGVLPLGDVVNTVIAPAKLKKEAYREIGAIPIIDQGASFITGYTDENIKALPSDEYVIFCDHSEHIK